MAPAASTHFVAATVADADAIRTMVRAAYSKWVPVVGREPRPMATDYATAVLDYDVDLLYRDAELVGVIQMKLHPDHLWVQNVAVAPQWHGQGYGRQLLSHAQDRAMKAGLPELRLLTNEAFVSNIVLYERFGFTLDRKEPFHLGGFSVYMSKRLVASG